METGKRMGGVHQVTAEKMREARTCSWVWQSDDGEMRESRGYLVDLWRTKMNVLNEKGGM